MSRYVPSLLGGLFTGVLASLPILNGCCCLWAVGGGVLVTYLLQQNDPMPIETSDAALQGLIAGAIGGLLKTIASAALFKMANLEQLQQVQDLMARPDTPEFFRRGIEWLSKGNNFLIVAFFITVPMYAVFSMAGSFLGLAFFRKKLPPTPQA